MASSPRARPGTPLFAAPAPLPAAPAVPAASFVPYANGCLPWLGAPEGLAELTTYYCEQASLSCQGIWVEEQGFHDALVRMYYQAIREVHKLEPPAHGPFASRLRTVRDRCVPWASTGDAIDDLFINSGLPGSDDESGASAPQT
jgi:hypothetical protein